jgi:hypothetical protein
MTAIPLARFLVEFGSDGDQSADGPHRHVISNPALAVDARIAEARAQGHADGRAAAEAEFAAQLESQCKDFEQQLAMARQTWAAAEGNALSEALLEALRDLEGRLAGTVARILHPFLEGEIRRASIDDLVATIETLLTRDQAVAQIKVSGPEDLLCVLRPRLAGKIPVAFVTNEACDVRVVIDQTTLETRLGAWIAAIEGAAR